MLPIQLWKPVSGYVVRNGEAERRAGCGALNQIELTEMSHNGAGLALIVACDLRNLIVRNMSEHSQFA